MDRQQKILGLAALASGLAAFHGVGWCVFLYPALLTWGLAGLSARKQIALAGLWGVLFAACFYHWVGAYGLLPWLALSLARGLPWALYPLPTLALLRGSGHPEQEPLQRLRAQEICGGAAGLSLVSLVLLAGMTGVDWETPAAALTEWPSLLSPLRWVGLSVVAGAIGLISHSLASRDWRFGSSGVGLLAVWLGVTTAFPLPRDSSPGPLKVALLQTGFSQNEKWDEAHRTVGVERLLGDTEKAARAGAQLVIWPETAWPYRGMRRRYTNTRQIGKTARRLKIDILASSIEEEASGDTGQADWLNTVSLVTAQGKFSAHYQKRRLAPFAEYLPLPDVAQKPLRRIRPFSSISQFVPGKGPVVFRTSGGHNFAALICYESMTSTIAAEMAPQVDFLVVVTNDAPFDHAQANEAHFRSAILRAIETGKPVLQAANTGVTGAIAGDGTVLVRTPPGVSGPSLQYITP